METNTNKVSLEVEAFLSQKEKEKWIKKQEALKKYIFTLIDEGNPEIVDFIEDNFLYETIKENGSLPTAAERSEGILDLSVMIPVKLKRKLKTILELYRSEFISELRSRNFSFESKTYKKN